MRLACWALLLWQAAHGNSGSRPKPQHFRYARALQSTAPASGIACAVLDGEVYAHATAGLADVRLFAGQSEVPYVLTMSQTAPVADTVRPLNLHLRGGKLLFDLPMPARPYSAVDLLLGGQNWLATAKVTGFETLEGKESYLGTFTLFDLASQRLGRRTSVALAESTFPFLHVELAAQPAPGSPGFVAGTTMVDGATVPPSRIAQTVYTKVAETRKMLQMGASSIATFEVPAHVPVERVSFELDPDERRNFSLSVHVEAKAMRKDGMVEPADGIISRVNLTEAGREIREEALHIPATLGSNSESAMRVQVAVDDDAVTPKFRAVKLEMRERKLCFDAIGQPVTMYYGDDALSAPVYDYSRIIQPGATAATAQLAPEGTNPQFVPRPAAVMSLTERHPETLRVAVLGLIAVLGVLAFRSRRRHHA